MEDKTVEGYVQDNKGFCRSYYAILDGTDTISEKVETLAGYYLRD